MGQPHAATGVVDRVETGTQQNGRGAELRLITQADFGANRNRVGKIAADAGIGADR
jgi:hypothetical protein